jgi:glycosyltransferase involved in cell wall biosynthesis
MKNISDVTIIVPVYNKEEYLQECLDSIRNQTLDNIEIICIDDGSTDGSLRILEKNARDDYRIKIISHKKNKGIIHARKSGLVAASGEFTSFVDADDLASAHMCQSLYEAAEMKKADFIQCNAKIYDPKSILSPDIYRLYNNSVRSGRSCSFKGEEIFKRYTQPIRNILFISFYKTKICKKVASFINENAPRRGDDDLLSFFFFYFAKKYFQLNKILYKYRASETSSNLNRITYKIAKSQIEGRAEAIRYAKWFTQKNGLIWKSKEMPFSAFTFGLVDYAASFIDRYIDGGGDKEEELMRIFGDCFGGEALIYLLRRKKTYERFYGNQYHLKNELNALYSSRSWKITAPLRWGVRKIRGY